jgi:hypothetical protein
MKKLIVLSVIFALVAGGLFAMDVTGTVFARVDLAQGSTAEDDKNTPADESAKTTSGGTMQRVRLDGSGQNDDGTFGGYIRWQNGGIDSVNAWWKPIDQFKMLIGNNSDGFWGREGVTGWGFNQMPYDSGVAFNPGTWYGNGWSSSPYFSGYGVGPFMCNRYTFFEGFVDYGLLLEITPMDMVSINVGVPFLALDGNETADIFGATVAQLNINLDVGTIAVTYVGSAEKMDKNVHRSVSTLGGGAIYGYFGGSFGDLGLDVGFSYRLKGEDTPATATTPKVDAKALPIGVGVGAKYATDSFGVKFRTVATLPSDDYKVTTVNVSVVPYFTISDSLTAFVNAGLGMALPDEGDTLTGWYFNPYLRVGEEWGPTFYFGIQLWSGGKSLKTPAAGLPYEIDPVINWAVPISIMLSF